jgi:hypothetical protein
MKLKDEQLVGHYLMSCFLYYQKNESVLSDKEFDDLCLRLLDKWKTIKHPHKKLIKKANLEAQTGYDLKRVPKIVQVCAFEWLEESKKEKVSMEDLFE